MKPETAKKILEIVNDKAVVFRDNKAYYVLEDEVAGDTEFLIYDQDSVNTDLLYQIILAQRNIFSMDKKDILELLFNSLGEQEILEFAKDFAKGGVL